MPNVIQGMVDQATQLVGGYLPNLLGALAILVIGWLVALIVGALVRGTLHRTSLDNRVARWLMGDARAEEVPIERYVGKAFYYVVMLFVLVAFFQALNLTIITEPLNALLNQLTEFAPRLVGAALLLAIAGGVATVLRRIVSGGLGAFRLDERLGGEPTERQKKGLPLSQTLGDAVYWLVFLLFLPAILGALALEGLLTPVQTLLNEVLGYLPNLLAAGLILMVGWFLARLVQRIVTNLLAAVGLDRVSETAGLARVIGATKLSSVAGTVVYILILIPVLISSLNTLALEAVTQPASNMLGTILAVIPTLFAAVLLLTIAYLVAQWMADLVSNLLAGVGFNNVLAHLGLGQRVEPPDGRAPSAIVGRLIPIAIMLFASIEAARLLGFETLGNLISEFVLFGGQVILGLIIFGIGLYLGNLAAAAVQASATAQASVLALVTRVAILVLAAAMALRQMGLANEIVTLAFGLLLGAIAVAAALAFGLGARDTAGRAIERWVGRWKVK